MARGPSRESLLVGAAIIALYGFEMEKIATLRAHNVPNWTEHPDLVACRALTEALRKGACLVQEDNPMWRTLAHAQQVLRVSLEEWESVLRITPLHPA